MVYAIVVVLILIADQLMKYWVTANITLNTGSIDLIDNVLRLVNIHNEGAAFSLLEGYRWIFVGIALAVSLIIILSLAFRWIKGGFGRWMAVFVMAGALGNAIDRAIYGYVVDMFEIIPVKFMQIFNIADIFITVGGILFCIYLLFSGKKSKSTEEYEEELEESNPDQEENVEAEDDKIQRVEKVKAAYSEFVKEPEEEMEVEETPEVMEEEPSEEEPEAATETTEIPQAVIEEPKAEEKPEIDFNLDDILNEFK